MRICTNGVPATSEIAASTAALYQKQANFVEAASSTDAASRVSSLIFVTSWLLLHVFLFPTAVRVALCSVLVDAAEHIAQLESALHGARRDASHPLVFVLCDQALGAALLSAAQCPQTRTKGGTI